MNDTEDRDMLKRIQQMEAVEKFYMKILKQKHVKKHTRCKQMKQLEYMLKALKEV